MTPRSHADGNAPVPPDGNAYKPLTCVTTRSHTVPIDRGPDRSPVPPSLRRGTGNGYPIPAVQFLRCLTRLVDAGRLTRPGRGLYAPVPSVPSVPSGSGITENGTHGTHGTRTCTACNFPLDPAVVAEGFTTHPACSSHAPDERTTHHASHS